MTLFPPLPRSDAGTLPPFERAALLLDLDGTLLDIAPAPDQVVVPPDLPTVLHTLRRALSDALAIITGRTLTQIDALLPDVPHAIAGEHGATIRHAPNALVQRPPLPALPGGWAGAAERLATAYPGVIVEQKERGFAVHYRAVPQHGETLRRVLLALLDTAPGPFVLLEAKMAWEVRPRGADKGTAVAALMALPPFTGRLPLFIGDDVTDEDAISAARAAGGVGLRVPACFGDAAGVRAWLAAAAQRAPTR